jgi:4-hydroxy-3-polyprenylbenzoate decarboxylase
MPTSEVGSFIGSARGFPNNEQQNPMTHRSLQKRTWAAGERQPSETDLDQFMMKNRENPLPATTLSHHPQADQVRHVAGRIEAEPTSRTPIGRIEGRRPASTLHSMNKTRIIVGLSGASGVIYGIRTLEHLRAMKHVETHLVMSDRACVNIRIETSRAVGEIEALADVVHRPDNLAAAISSGSYKTDGMIVVPCSVKSLSGIVNSYADNLLTRAADVCLKEKRKLVLVVRETPLHKGHLELMVKAADLGAVILPPMPAFYHRPKSIEDIIDQTIGKAFDHLELDHHLFRRWGENKRGVETQPS